jgi:hypothetical protein
VLKRLRDPYTGRIHPRTLQRPYPVDASPLLGVKLPAQVARHGSAEFWQRC